MSAQAAAQSVHGVWGREHGKRKLIYIFVWNYFRPKSISRAQDTIALTMLFRSDKMSMKIRTAAMFVDAQ